jgi:putative peptidoglycan lipid II flippase
LIGSAIGVVLLPTLTRALRSGQAELANHHQNRAIELGLVLSLPAAVGLVIASHPIIAAVYQRGAFKPADTAAVAAALSAVAAGLPAYVLNKALAPGFLAREDTMTPFRFAMIAVGADIVISLTLFHFIGYIGIACGTAGAAWLNAGMLYWRLRQQNMLSADPHLKRTLPRLLISAAIMGVALWFAIAPVQNWFGPGNVGRIASLFTLIGSASCIYAVAALLTGAVSLREMRQQMRRRSSTGKLEGQAGG